MSDSKPNVLPAPLFWLEDAPLFTDSDQVGRFYDAVASPENKQKSISLEFTEEKAETLKGTLKLEASLSPGKLAALLSPLFAFVTPTLKAGGEAEGATETKGGQKTVIELEPISTPQRQLKQLALHYLVNQPSRIRLVEDASESEWRDPKFIEKMPRGLLFLSLPGGADADKRGVPATKLIPMAAEFADGAIVQLYKELDFGEGKPPAYPSSKLSGQERNNWWKDHWNWFAEHYNALKAIIAIEKAASEHGRIRWIDYRLPLTNEGATLHIHVSPAGEYDTGVFAYNFVKRGATHGIYLVGTLKSGPDLNVLAIYER